MRLRLAFSASGHLVANRRRLQLRCRCSGFGAHSFEFAEIRFVWLALRDSDFEPGWIARRFGLRLPISGWRSAECFAARDQKRLQMHQ
jgi:hypothetical protein